MQNLLPEFGKVLTNNNKKDLTFVYNIKFPKYIDGIYGNYKYNETFEEFKDRMIEVVKLRLKNNQLQLENIRFIKMIASHPSMLTRHSYSTREFRKYYKEKTLEELINDYGLNFKEKLTDNDYYKPKKYKSICIKIDVSRRK